jgi:hypothetical protein
MFCAANLTQDIRAATIREWSDLDLPMAKPSFEISKPLADARGSDALNCGSSIVQSSEYLFVLLVNVKKHIKQLIVNFFIGRVGCKRLADTDQIGDIVKGDIS